MAEIDSISIISNINTLNSPFSMSRASSIREGSIIYTKCEHLNEKVDLANYLINNFEEGLIGMKKLLQKLFGKKRFLLNFGLNNLQRKASSVESFFRQAEDNLDDIIQLVKEDLTNLEATKNGNIQEIEKLYQGIKEEEATVEKLKHDLKKNEEEKEELEKSIKETKKDLDLQRKKINAYHTGILSRVYSLISLLPFGEKSSSLASLESAITSLEEKCHEDDSYVSSLKNIISNLNVLILQRQNDILAKEEEKTELEENTNELTVSLDSYQEQCLRIIQLKTNLNKKLNSVSRVQLRTNVAIVKSQEINDFKIIINTILKICSEIETLIQESRISAKITRLTKQANTMLESEFNH